MSSTTYKRILLKLSGESLAGTNSVGIESSILTKFAKEVKKIYDLKVQIGIVIGGGNIFRGLSSQAKNMDRVQADYMGMLATLINSMAMQDALSKKAISTILLSGLPVEPVAEKTTKTLKIQISVY